MKKSSVIKYHQMMIPTVKALHLLGGSATIDELNSKVIDIMKPSKDMLDVMHKEDGTVTEIEYRLAWARTYLKKYGILDNSSRGVWSFSNSFDGDIDALSPEEIVKTVKSVRRSNIERIKNGDVVASDDDGEFYIAPINWRDNLRDVLLRMTPDAFERLTLRLLRESGFTQVEVTGKSNDRGIDGKGIIRLHGIMSFHMIFQCKRYKGSVTPSEIRDFRGAMQGRADKGLFITTGSFTSEAKKEAIRDGAPPLDLIDGDDLIERLKDLGLGVSEKIIKDYIINDEWFMKI